MRTIHDRSITANDEGETLIQSMERRLQNLETQVAELKTQTVELKEDNRKPLDLRNMYLNVRERAFLIFLRDRCAGYKEANKDRLKPLEQSLVHSGDALADASVFLERRSVYAQKEERRLFKRIYGLHAETIKQLERNGYRSIMRVLDAVGLAHLQGIMALKEDQEKIFNKIVELVQDGKAEHTASCGIHSTNM